MKTLINTSIILCVSLFQLIGAMELSLEKIKTPKKYYDYKNLHSEYRLKTWQDKKSNIANAIAQANNNVELIKSIVNRPEWGKTGYTPLCSAIEMNDCAFTQFLITHGAEVNGVIKNVHSSRPIFFANTLEMVQLLKKNGACLEGFNGGRGITSRMNLIHSVLHSAAKSKCDDRLVVYLLSLGFKIEDTVFPEDHNNIRLIFEKALTPGLSNCCHDRLAACIERVCKNLSTNDES